MATTSYRDTSRELKQMALCEYDDAIDEFCHDNPGLDVYLAGSLSQPGVSDLDLLVLDEQPHVNARVRKLLFGGNVLVFPRHLFERIDEIEQFELQCVQGREIQRCLKPPRSMFEPIEVLEWLPERILLLKHMTAQLDVEARIAALAIKSMARSIENACKNIDCRSTAASCAHDLMLGREEPRNMCAIWGSKHGQRAWDTFDASFSLITCESVTGRVSLSEHYQFVDNYRSLLAYFALVLQHDCELSRELATRVSVECKGMRVDGQFKQFALDRWALLDEVFVWFKSNGYKHGMLKYGWLL